MTYDSLSDRVILFGGIHRSPSIIPNDTWGYDTDRNTWTNLTTTTSPPRYDYPSMGYDIRSDRVVLFGSANSYNGPPDTWLYDYDTNSWVNATTSSRPSARDWSAMAYDQANDRMVLFGGMDSSFHYLNDIWTYELSNIPYAEKVSPSNGILDPSVSSNVVISFSELMDRGATERAITLTPQVPMSASWDASGKVLTLSPRSSFEPGASMAVRISTNATSVDGHGLRYDFAFSFVIFKPAPLPSVDTGTAFAILVIAAAVTAATAIALTEWLLYAFLILLMPLYMKVRKEKVLDNFMRGRIYQFIIHCPGAHLRFIKRVLGVEMGVLCHHLKVLERSGLIRSDKRGNLKRFF
jgi:hypothetical protein